MVRVLAAALSLLCAASAAHQAAPLDLSLSREDGSYNISVDGELWFQSGPTFIKHQGEKYTTTNATLLLKNVSTLDGQDPHLGDFVGYLMEWQTKDGVKYHTSIQSYGDTLIFEQRFPDGIADTGYNAANYEDLLTSFPSILMKDPFTNVSESVGKGYLAFQGRFLEGSRAGAFSGQNPSYEGGAYGGPCAIFDANFKSVVFSPFNQFMAASFGTETVNSAGWSVPALETGVMGGVTSIPAGFSYKAVMKLGVELPGVAGAVKEWGAMMMGVYNKSSVHEDAATKSKDMSLNYLGFSTDNGAFYYSHTEAGQNYEKTVLDVQAYAKREGIPYQYILLDSWWYYQGPGGGVKNWTSRPDVFPDGMRGLYEKTGWKVQGHNRYWCNETDYAKQNGGQYDFILQPQDNPDGVGGLPTSQAFWDDLMENATEWGLGVYEQDWLYNEFQSLNATLEDVGLGREWLMQMGAGAEKAGVTIQYCMSLPRFILQSLEIPAVTQLRAGDDYHPGQSTTCSYPYCVYYIGTSSIVAWALGLAAAKDDFWSTNQIQVQGAPNNTRYHNDTEPYSVMEAAISAFSTGPVQPSDAINYSNATLIGMTCTPTSGTLLQPSRPATAIDACFGRDVFGEGFDGPVARRQYNYPVMSTHTAVPVRASTAALTAATVTTKFASVLTIGLNEAWELFPRHLPLDVDSHTSDRGDDQGYAYVAWTGYGPASNVTVTGAFDARTGVALAACDYFDFQLHHAAPVLADGWAFLGEPAKFVPVSVQRVRGIAATGTGLQVEVHGDEGEEIELAFASLAAAESQEPTGTLGAIKVVSVICKLGASGRATASVPEGVCS